MPASPKPKRPTALAMAEALDEPVVVFHVAAARRSPRSATPRRRGCEGLRRDLPAIPPVDRGRPRPGPGLEGAKCVAARRRATAPTRRRCGAARRNGNFRVTSDHAPYRFEGTGELRRSGTSALHPDRERHAPASRCECRSCSRKGFDKDRIELNELRRDDRDQCGADVRPASAGRGRSRSGRTPISRSGIRSKRDRRSPPACLHDNVGYTPYEGRRLRGWPVTVVSRGRVVVEDGKLDGRARQRRLPALRSVGSGEAPCAPRFRNSPSSPKPVSR